MKLEKKIGELLRERGQTLSVAESCTGGLVGDRITNVSGSSDYFQGGIVSYSIEAKARHLRIPIYFIKRYGAVSSQVARKMAEGVRKAFQTTYGLSTTGVAGPTGGTKRTPVGTVFIGFSDGKETLAKKENFRGSRREIKEQAVKSSLQFLHEQLVLRNAECGVRNAEEINRLVASRESRIFLIRKAPQGISGRKGRLGIFPASFNPPTMAHRALIREARKAADLEEILVLLDVAAMDKRPSGAKFEDRLQMVKTVFQGDPKISIGLSNHGRFIGKLKPLRALYPSPMEFIFIVGFDTILRVMDKKYYRNRRRELYHLFRECRFLVANRGDQDREAFEKLFRERGNEKYRGQVSYFNLPKRFASLSSSLVREKIRKHEAITNLVPAPVLRSVMERGFNL